MDLNPPYRGRQLSLSASLAIWNSRCLLLVIGASAIVLFGKSDLKAIAQETVPSASQTRTQPSTRSQTQRLLWVNSQTGNDAKADGSEQAPFRTLTRALEAAQSNTVIQLAPGTYSTDTGEVFPIALKSGITIQGNADDLGHGIVVRGGGSYSSQTAGSQNITLIGASQATLIGISVTNPNSRGHGLWIETGNPTIRDSTFIGNTNAGLVTTGSSAPIVQNNLFVLNRTNGMMITGHAQPQVQDNIFQRTGAGVTISENAAPQIISNRISQNRDGIVVQGNAHPILRNNTVEDSQRDGLVVIAQAQPNLGTAKDPGKNTFLNNRQHDINALATSQTLPAFGNQIASNQIAGKIDLTGTASLVSVATVASAADRLPATQVTRSTSSQSTSSRRSAQLTPSQPRATAITQSPPLISTLPPSSNLQPQQADRPAPQPVSTSSSPTEARPPRPATTATSSPARSAQSSQLASLQTATRTITQRPRPTQPAAIEVNVPPPERPSATRSSSAAIRPTSNQPASTATPQAPRTPQAIAISVPPPELRAQPAQLAVSQLANVAVTAAASLPRQSFTNTPVAPALGGTPINTPVPPPEQRQAASTAPPGSISLLPVPSGEIPVGNTDGVSRVNVANGQGSGALLVSQRENLRYRVVVEAADEQVQLLVQSLVPGAFATSINGQFVMQVGAFSSRDNAEEAIGILSRNGLQGIIQPME